MSNGCDTASVTRLLTAICFWIWHPILLWMRHVCVFGCAKQLIGSCLIVFHVIVMYGKTPFWWRGYRVYRWRKSWGKASGHHHMWFSVDIWLAPLDPRITLLRQDQGCFRRSVSPSENFCRGSDNILMCFGLVCLKYLVEYTWLIRPEMYFDVFDLVIIWIYPASLRWLLC